ncbi:MAG: MFS transporter [Gemmatimonadota bacterium]
MEPLSRARISQLLAIALVAFNLRPALASVGPLVPEIRAATGLSNTALGFLTSLPLLAFAALSLGAPWVGRRMGIERTLTGALLLVVAGTGARGAPSVTLLYGGTLLLGIGIALANVLLPALAKRDFAHHSGPITSLYSSAMGLGAGVAAGVSVPLAGWFGWETALAIWAVPAGFALLVWLPRIRDQSRIGRIRGGGLRSMLKSPLAWAVALFMGLQSLSFYVVLTWLPDLLGAAGVGEAEAGWLLALSQATGVLGTLLVPLWAGRREDQRRIVWVLALLEVVSLGALLVPDVIPPVLPVALLGFVLGGTFGLALTLLLVRAADVESSSDLSGMAQSIGYLLAAVAPPLFGLLRDLSGGWTVPVVALGGVVAGKVAAGLPAARARQVGGAPQEGSDESVRS